MSNPTVSVVVVSRGRPESLLWCLTALAGVLYEPFEIVVVADEAGCLAVTGSVFDSDVKLVRFDEANISAARNKGVAQAAGEVIAFIDDDAAAEPMWLAHLIAPFEDESVTCTGGYVRGRNGISLQWAAREVNFQGVALPLEAAGLEPFTPKTREGFVVKTEGCNMAVQRKALRELGGFDEAFHFYLDETDLNLRLGKTGGKTVLVPLAEVHHAYKASPRRRDDRAVTDLFDVGASIVALLRKHGQPLEPRCSEMAEEQVERLRDQQQRGLMNAKEAARLLKTLESGFEAGKERPIEQYLPEKHMLKTEFLPFSKHRATSRVLSGRWRNRTRLRKKAADLAAEGANVSLFLFSFDTRFHHLRFVDAGYWEQTGGQFGRSERNQPLFQLLRLKTRLQREQARVALARGLPD
ncbi:glycosyltransferase family 2 protein [Lentibacter algarum]|uniref:glycosyltransferase family 2 protein n=1 Tax=Lentibacter algarum TaxID=576131 RepID=UPI001C0732F6|nr:glycosyltransferase family 2 protein [Lentibacter algarum]MBU2981056.1 glycosyltransferase family 2 protein [Lentibacter algarum]